MEIRRDFYLDKLIQRKNNGLIKVITGIRRCGKSYLLNTLFYQHLLDSGVPKEHIIRFAFDSLFIRNLHDFTADPLPILPRIILHGQICI